MKLNFLGIGSAWNINEDNTLAYIKKDDKMILIDCGESITRKIIANDILSGIKELYILISHTHSDHVGSLGTLLFYSKYNKQIANKIVLPKDECFTANLKEYLRLVDITTEVEFVDFSDLISAFNLIKFDILKATHVKTLPCYCFVLEDEEGLVYYSTDNSNVDYIKHYLQYPNSKIYTEICDSNEMQEEHLSIGLLEQSISSTEKKRIYLMHINEMLNVSELLKKGYNIPKIEKKEGIKLCKRK